MLSGLISWLDKFSLVQVLFVVDISDMCMHVGSGYTSLIYGYGYSRVSVPVSGPCEGLLSCTGSPCGKLVVCGW